MQSDAHNGSAATLVDSVTTRLRTLILSGAYQPGQRLTEASLAEEMSVSRTPVVASLKALTEQGLVRYAPNRGYWVREFTIDEVLNAYELRATLEGLGCRLAAERGLSGQDIDTLERCIAVGDDVLSGPQLRSEDHERYQAMNVEFHTVILRASGNGLLGDFVRKSHELPLASNRVVFWRSMDIVRRSHDAHVRVLDALKQRQGTRAEMLMREHVYESGQVLRRHWDEITEAARQGATAVSRVIGDSL
ncbi:GntR family transcriptional regulator [Caldimonas thermodepolymerans]|uniref:GntR family transcriptional regulator n=1 Tax=Caldimonas thermodepolymerans TaxID=215580 RepID=UPI002235BFE5|nr:GntR family transcriptional regulator [Caldimonas thermodepolymerans]UZG44387.1 GntR family transcriptional regulator [Caldimonas thermodepolymerans]